MGLKPFSARSIDQIDHIGDVLAGLNVVHHNLHDTIGFPPEHFWRFSTLGTWSFVELNGKLTLTNAGNSKYSYGLQETNLFPKSASASATMFNTNANNAINKIKIELTEDTRLDDTCVYIPKQDALLSPSIPLQRAAHVHLRRAVFL